MIRFPIPVLFGVVVLAVFLGSTVEHHLERQAIYHSRPDRSTPLAVRFVPDAASSADSFVCVPDPAATPNAPAMQCMDLSDFLHRLEARRAKTQGDL